MMVSQVLILHMGLTKSTLLTPGVFSENMNIDFYHINCDRQQKSVGSYSKSKVLQVSSLCISRAREINMCNSLIGIADTFWAGVRLCWRARPGCVRKMAALSGLPAQPLPASHGASLLSLS